MIIYTQPYVRGSKKNTVMVELKDAANAPVTGKVAADITATVIRWRENPDRVNVSQLANAIAPFNGGGWSEVNAATLPGLYRFDLRNADFVSDGRTDTLLVSVRCTGCQPVYLAIPMTDVDESVNTIDRS